jgi:hypothetical protein
MIINSHLHTINKHTGERPFLRQYFLFKQALYNTKISTNFTIKDLSIGCIFPYEIRSQRGLTYLQIIENLKNVSEYILEPIYEEYPNMIINSAFRSKPSIVNDISQHELGEAVDLQFKGFIPKDYILVSEWIINNVNFDNLIFEHGKSIWLHISCKLNIDENRKEVLTMFNGQYERGIKLYY